MVRLGLQLVFMFCVKHFGLGFSRVFPSGEFGNRDIRKTLGKGGFFMINGIHFKREASSHVDFDLLVKYICKINAILSYCLHLLHNMDWTGPVAALRDGGSFIPHRAAAFQKCCVNSAGNIHRRICYDTSGLYHDVPSFPVTLILHQNIIIIQVMSIIIQVDESNRLESGPVFSVKDDLTGFNELLLFV